MIFLHILLAIQPVIAAYQHHINSSIQCPDVVSFCPFKPPTTTLCLHFSIKSSIFIPPALSPTCLFILLLLAGDINPNPGPPKCLNITYANIRSINPAIAKFISDNNTDLFAMSETWIRPDTTRSTCLRSPHQVTVSINSHKRPAVVEDWGFSLKIDWMHPLFLQRPAPPLKISSSRYP